MNSISPCLLQKDNDDGQERVQPTGVIQGAYRGLTGMIEGVVCSLKICLPAQPDGPSGGEGYGSIQPQRNPAAQVLSTEAGATACGNAESAPSSTTNEAAVLLDKLKAETSAQVVGVTVILHTSKYVCMCLPCFLQCSAFLSFDAQHTIPELVSCLCFLLAPPRSTLTLPFPCVWCAVMIT